MSVTHDPVRPFSSVAPGTGPGRSAERGAAPMVLVVGSGAAGEELTRRVRATTSLGQHDNVVRVDDYFMALGSLAVDGLPRVVVGLLAEMGDDIEATVTALRRLAPQVGLVVVAGENAAADGPARALRAGVDGCFTWPWPADAFSLWVPAASVTPSPTASSVPATPASAPTTAPTPATPESSADQPSPRAERDSAWTQWSTRMAPQELVAAVQRSFVGDSLGGPGLPKVEAVSAPTADEELGDVDLVQHLLQQRPHFADLLCRLMAARSGLPLQLVRGTEAPLSADHLPAGHVQAPLIWQGRPLGVLHAPAPAARDALTPWADWAAQWLALDTQLTGLWDLALKDELTGVWNRRYFSRFLRMLVERAAVDRFRVTLMLFDIDDFKQYNDRFGHAAGDDILREAGRLMRSVVRPHDVVARIGGDEFAVIFWDAQGPRRPHSQHPDDVRQAARRFQRAITSAHFPRLGDQAPGTLTISGGLAGFPWDGRTPEELCERADAMCLESKRQGKNALTFGPGAGLTADRSQG